MLLSWGTGVLVMEVLKRSIEKLSAPVCPECNVEMAWFRSALVAAEQREFAEAAHALRLRQIVF